MEEEKKLYPFRLAVLEDAYSWGTDTFRLADLGYRETLVRDGWLAGNTLGEVMDLYMDRVVGERVFSFFGRQFPVQVKDIRVRGRMPLRVHPDNEIALQRYDLLGREKLWYVQQAGPGATLYLGLREDMNAGTFYSACLDCSIIDHLNAVHPKAGDRFFLSPGTVHAAEGDLRIIEVSQSSPLDFLLCGWHEPVSPEEFEESLDLVSALDFISYKRYEAGHETEFNVEIRPLRSPMQVSDADSFVVYSCLRGNVNLRMVQDSIPLHYSLKEGETLLIPSECPDYLVEPEGEALILEVSVNPQEIEEFPAPAQK